MSGLLAGAARRLLGLGCLVPAHKRAILAYHDVSPRSAPQHSPYYSTEPHRFERHLDLLQQHFRLVDLDEIVAPAPSTAPDRRADNRPLAALTFDDGFLSVAQTVQPLLARRQIPFALFVNGLAMRENRLEYLSRFEAPVTPPGTRVYLNAPEVAELAAAGVLVGSHGTSHQPLRARTDADLAAQITDNKDYLEQLLDRPIRHFALPYGMKETYDRRAVRHCHAAGHHWVYSNNPSLFEARDLRAKGDAPGPVPRMGVTGESDAQLFFLLNRSLYKRVDI